MIYRQNSSMSEEENEITHINTKAELIEALEKELDELEGFNHYILVIEAKKFSEKYAIYKGEFYDSGDLKYRGSITLSISKKDSIFESLEVGESKFLGFTLDSREETAREVFIDFLKRSLKENTLRDFIPLTGS